MPSERRIIGVVCLFSGIAMIFAMQWENIQKSDEELRRMAGVGEFSHAATTPTPKRATSTIEKGPAPETSKNPVVATPLPSPMIEPLKLPRLLLELSGEHTEYYNRNFRLIIKANDLTKIDGAWYGNPDWYGIKYYRSLIWANQPFMILHNDKWFYSKQSGLRHQIIVHAACPGMEPIFSGIPGEVASRGFGWITAKVAEDAPLQTAMLWSRTEAYNCK